MNNVPFLIINIFWILSKSTLGLSVQKWLFIRGRKMHFKGEMTKNIIFNYNMKYLVIIKINETKLCSIIL